MCIYIYMYSDFTSVLSSHLPSKLRATPQFMGICWITLSVDKAYNQWSSAMAMIEFELSCHETLGRKGVIRVMGSSVILL